MSYRPQPLARFKPTGCVSPRCCPHTRRSPIAARHTGPRVPARQAYSHCASDGSESSSPSTRSFRRARIAGSRSSSRSRPAAWVQGTGSGSRPSLLPTTPGCRAWRTSRSPARSSPRAGGLHQSNLPSSSSGEPKRHGPGGIHRRRIEASAIVIDVQGAISSCPQPEAQAGGMPRARG